jgi:formamidopyrimidine-DNA glycosylase
MPELPEVETVVRGLRRAKLCGVRIVGSRVLWERTIAGVSPADFRRALDGVAIETIDRRAKYILMGLSSGQYLLIHLRMTGSLRVVAKETANDAHERVAILFADGRELRFWDTRKFGRWYLVDKPDKLLGRLGPEPLDRSFDDEAFVRMLGSHRRMLKPLLLDQTFLAGLGNIYVDEALFAARLHPCRIASRVSSVAARRLYVSIQSVLRLGIARMGTSLGQGAVNFYSVAGRRGRNQDALQVFRRDGEACLVCGTTIQRLLVGQRSTHVCPRCQPGPRKRGRRTPA